jgi:GNAT superfamily N-acetyltransferase
MNAGEALPAVDVRVTMASDIPGVIELSRDVYPSSPPWTEKQLVSHLAVFPEGQFVAIERSSGRVVGMAASLIVLWDDYDTVGTWRDFTDGGYFRNHDPMRGRTLYGAEVMVAPDMQGKGVGSALYAAREALVRWRKLLRIRAGARLRGYHRVAARMSPAEYVTRVLRNDLTDPTLSFQLAHGFRVLAVVAGYLHHDPQSLGFAAVIEWINKEVATPSDFQAHSVWHKTAPEEGLEPPTR